MDVKLLDQIITLQLTVARLGEQPQMNWWTVNIAYENSGADFLERLVGKEMGLLAAGEALLLAAGMKEQALLKNVPGQAVFSLFHPEPALQQALESRYRHYKKYPSDTPASVADVLAPHVKMGAADLFNRMCDIKPAKYQGTSFGREIKRAAGWGQLETMTALASVLSVEDKNKYPLPYYKEDHAA